MHSISNFGLHQFVTEPTQFSNTGTANTLDLLFSNDPCAIVVTNHLPPFSTSDHVMIEFSTFLPFQDFNDDPEPIKLSVYDWSVGDYQAISSALQSVDWHALFGYHFDVNSLWLQFKNIIWPLIDQYIPKKTIVHNKKHNPRAYPNSIKKLLTRKAAIWRSLKNNKSDTRLRSKYSEIANQCRLAILNYDLEKEKKILETNNLGAFLNFPTKKLSSPSGISPLLNADGILLTADPDKAKLLSEYFASVYRTDDHTTPPFKSRLPSETIRINDVPISIKNVTKIISKLKSNSAAGPDLLPPIFFVTPPLPLVFHFLSCFDHSLIYATFLMNGDKPLLLLNLKREFPRTFLIIDLLLLLVLSVKFSTLSYQLPFWTTWTSTT